MTMHSTNAQNFDLTRRFVRKLHEYRNGFVEFEFAIGEPEVFIEMVLTGPAYEEFCELNQVEFLSAYDKEDTSGEETCKSM